MPGKVFGRVLTENLMEVTKQKLSEEQGGCRKGNVCVDLIFAIRIVVEGYLRKGK